MSNYTKAGDVTVKDLITQEVKRVESTYTEKELKVIINNNESHKNSIAELIKNNTELQTKFHANRTKYMEDYEAMMFQYKVRYDSGD